MRTPNDLTQSKSQVAWSQTVQLEQLPVAVGPFQVPRECDDDDDDDDDHDHHDDDDDDDYEDDDDDDGFADERSQIFSKFLLLCYNSSRASPVLP